MYRSRTVVCFHLHGSKDFVGQVERKKPLYAISKVSVFANFEEDSLIKKTMEKLVV